MELSYKGEGWEFTFLGDSCFGYGNLFGDKTYFKMIKSKTVSPTLGLTAPENAISLLTENTLSKWKHDDGRDSLTWKLKDGVLETTSELMDWSKSGDDLLKYYSGKAKYTTMFTYQKSDAKDVVIDLGEVGVMATVTLNGKNVGTSWMTPYSLNITDAVQEGENSLEIEVVNVWLNRLTGDKTLPVEQRTTSVLVDYITSEEAMSSSGLLGPVTIQTTK